MPNWIVSYWGQWLFGIIGSGLLATLAALQYRAGRLKRMEKRMAGLEQATRASIFDRLFYLHGRFCQQGWISVADFKNVEGIYDGYHALGGNGTGTKLYEDLKALPNYPPQ